ncbi:MAG: alpha/beta fold hydrolase, partial [Sphingomonadaceae bacterium]
AAQVVRLKAFLDMMGIERCHLGGNSMGGFIALAFALDHPDRVASLSLFNNAGVDGPEQSRLQEQMSEGENPIQVRSPRDVDRVLRLIIHRPPLIPFFIRYLILAEHRRYEHLLNSIFEQVIRDALERPLGERLPEIQMPTIIFWGEQDQLLHVSAARFQHEHITGSKLVIFDNVGHVPMIEKPCGLARHHRKFLAEAEAE